MKTVLACILLGALTVNGGGKDGPGGIAGFPERFGGYPGGYRCERPTIGECSCGAANPTRFSKNPCRGVTGSQSKGCPNTNQYLQCTDTVCAVQTCPSGQVWNSTQKACAACANGMHVAANLKVCVCNQGTTFVSRNRTCVPCPTDSTTDPDTCYCPATKAFDSRTYACRDCPSGSTLSANQQCQCTSKTQLWSDVDWNCKDCPGTWSPQPARNFRQPTARCICPTTNPLFDADSIQCYSCPTGITTQLYGRCICQNRYQSYNVVTKQCECIKGYTADPAGTGGCVLAGAAPAPNPGP